MNVYREDDLGIEFKGDDSPLTRADIASHNVIAEALKETALPILSEEGKDISYAIRKNWDLFWLVDPLDGTKEFIKRNGEFTVNIALIENNKPIFGVIYAPEPDLMYFGGENIPSRRMHGLFNKSTVTDQMITEDSTLLPDNQFADDKFRIVASRSHRNEATEDFIAEKKQQHELEFVPKGSSLKFCVIAEGGADCYPRFAPTMEWDTAAGHAICKGTGSSVMTKTGEPLEYNKPNLTNPSFIVHSSASL